MPGIAIIKVSLTVNIVISPDTLAQEFGELALGMGPALAEQIDSYSRENKLGYYPALDFFKQNDGVDQELLDSAEHISWMVCEWAQRKIRSNLREAFSNVQFDQIQSTAYSMPRIRPNMSRALALLTDHYSPDSVRLTVIVASIERSNINLAGYEKLAVHKFRRWLDSAFETIEFSDAHVITDQPAT